MRGRTAPRGRRRPLQTIAAGVLLTVCAALLGFGAPGDEGSATPSGLLGGARPPSVARHLLFSADDCATTVMQRHGCSEAGCEDVQQNGGGWVNYIMAEECAPAPDSPAGGAPRPPHLGYLTPECAVALTGAPCMARNGSAGFCSVFGSVSSSTCWVRLPCVPRGRHSGHYTPRARRRRRRGHGGRVFLSRT